MDPKLMDLVFLLLLPSASSFPCLFSLSILSHCPLRLRSRRHHYSTFCHYLK